MSEPPAKEARADEKKTRGARPRPATTGGHLVFYTVPGAGREFGQSAKTVRRLIEQGLLPARHLGGETVLLKADLDRFFRELPTITSVDGALARIVAKVQANGQGARR